MADLKFLQDEATKAALSDLAGNFGKLAAARLEKVGQPKSTEESEEAPGEGWMDRIKSSAKTGAITGGIKGAVKGIFSKGRKGSKTKLPTHIYEYVWVGVPVDVAYNQWVAWTEWAGYTKGVEAVSVADKDNPVETKWSGKVALSHRQWTGQIEDQIPGDRIKWTGQGKKGAVSGVVTFADIADNMTLVLLVLEYRPKGLVEWTGNRWRAVGRRARLDLKHYARHVTMAGEATGEAAWPGTIEDGRVTDDGQGPEDSGEEPEPVEPESEPDEGTEPESESDEETEPEPEPEPAVKPTKRTAKSGARQPVNA